MTERSAELTREDMSGRGLTNAENCEEAQTALVRFAKTLSDRDEIILVDSKNDNEMTL